jgi:hypothetical protein
MKVNHHVGHYVLDYAHHRVVTNVQMTVLSHVVVATLDV